MTRWVRPRDVVPKPRAAIAIGFVFDHALSEDLEPLESLFSVPLGGLTIGELLHEQIVEPLGRHGWTRQHRFEPGLLGEVIGGGQARSVALRRKHQPEGERFGIGVATAPPAYLDALDDLEEEPAAWRYDGTIEIGRDLLGDGDDVDRLLEDLLELWFDQIDVHTGAVIADLSIADACTIAAATGGAPGSDLQRRAAALARASRRWGPSFAREPEWGTYLRHDHVEAVGGLDEVESYVRPYRVLEGRRNVFVQLSTLDEALDEETAQKRARLEAVLRPILAGPMSRDGGADPDDE